MYRAIAVSVHVRIDSGAAERDEDRRQRLGREIDGGSAAWTGYPVRIRRRSRIY